MSADEHKFTLEITAYDNTGVIVRIAQVFARRGHSIETLNVERSNDPGTLPKLYVTAYGQKARFEQIMAQIKKLIDIQNVTLMEN